MLQTTFCPPCSTSRRYVVCLCIHTTSACACGNIHMVKGISCHQAIYNMNKPIYTRIDTCIQPLPLKISELVEQKTALALFWNCLKLLIELLLMGKSFSHCSNYSGCLVSGQNEVSVCYWIPVISCCRSSEWSTSAWGWIQQAITMFSCSGIS